MTAIISPEELKTPEIESPEELIKKLEENSKKTLAEKVKSVLFWINGTTEEKWQKLKAELSIDEEKEIRETLKDKETKIETVLNKWVTPTNLTDAKAIAWTMATKEWMDKVIEEWKKWFWESVKNLFSSLFAFLGNLPFIGWFFAAIWKMFGFGVKAEEAAQVVSEITKESRETINTEIKKTIKESKIPVDEKKLETALVNMTETDLKTLEGKIKNWEKITINDLKILESMKIVFSEESAKERLKKWTEEARKNIKNEIIRALKAKYQIDLSPQKEQILENLIKNELKINDNTIDIIAHAQTEQKIDLGQMLQIFREQWISTFMFSMKLITNGIIPISAVWLDFMNSWVELLASSIKLTTWFLWIEEHVNVETFNKWIDTLSREEKAILLALLYRKGWLFLNILWNTSAFISRFAIEWATNTSIKSMDAYKASSFSQLSKQADQLDIITKNLWWSVDKNDILRKAIENAQIVRKNYISLEILERNQTNVWDTIKELKEKWVHIEWNPKTMSELKLAIKWNFSQTFNTSISKWNLTNKLWFWASADLYEFNSKLESLMKYQRYRFEWSTAGRAFSKVWEILNSPSVSRVWDRLAFHFNSANKAKDFSKKLSIIANQTPELLKWIFDKLPIFVVAWIAANSEKGFFEEFWTEFKYLLPVVWPILLLNKAGLNWSNWIKVDNWVEASIWWALLTIDWIFLTKELATNWISWVWRYLAKPVTDIYSIWKWTANMWYNAYKLAEAAKWKELFKSALEKTRYIKWIPRLAALAAVVAAWWVAYAYSGNEHKEFVWKNWELDIEKLKKESAKMSNDEKAELIKMITTIEMWENLTKNIDFKVENNKLIIDSKNKSVQSNFIINDETREKIAILWVKWIKFNYYWQS